jgi:hypothetical protein
MATTWQTITVRVERPPEASLGDFFAIMRNWLDHHCIMLADFKAVTSAKKSGVFDACLDNPRDALLFGRRFGLQPPSNVPARRTSRWSSMDQGRASILADIAGDMRRLLWTRNKVEPACIGRDEVKVVRQLLAESAG